MTQVGVTHQSDLDETIEALKKELEEDYTPPHIKRHAHPKMHGLVQAIFRVNDDVPAPLRQGLFASTGKEFLAWVRFSNALGIQHDLKFENRGMAIKVMGVEGERLLPGVPPFSAETDTQDIVLSTGDAFVLPNPDNYAMFSAAARAGFPQLIAAFARRGLWRGIAALIRGGIVLSNNPLEITYFSQTPYRLGPNAVVKLNARPRSRATTWFDRLKFSAKMLLANVIFMLGDSKSGQWVLRLLGFVGTREAAETYCDRNLGARNLLRHSLAQSLSRSSAQFELYVQKGTKKQLQSIDDATVRWRTRRAKFRPVATITIPRQVFWPEPGMTPGIMRAAIQMMENGENMSFTPWHALAAHEPLGKINIARGKIYAEIATYRWGRNHTGPPDPVAEYHRLRPIVQHGLEMPEPKR